MLEEAYVSWVSQWLDNKLCSYCTIGIVCHISFCGMLILFFITLLISALLLQSGHIRELRICPSHRSSIFPSSIRESVEFFHWWFIVFSFGSHTDASTCAVRLSFLSHQIERTILNRSRRMCFIACETPQHEDRFVFFF